MVPTYALGRRTQMTRPNGVNTNYTYDNLSRLLSVLHQLGGNTIDGATYSVDGVGNRTSKTNHLNSEISNYTYGQIYQLTQVVIGGNTSESYTYDEVGNRLSSLGVSPYTYNSLNQLTSTPSATFTYDNNGNTITKVETQGTTAYSWDFENRLVSVTLPDESVVSFDYDPFGRRIRKLASGSTIFIYDGAKILEHEGDDIIEEVDGTGTAIARYTHGVGLDEPLGAYRPGSTYYFQADGLDSVTSLTGSVPTIAASYTYDSFGGLTSSTGSPVNAFNHTARERDADINLYHYRARYLDITTGRFLSEDPLRFDAWINYYSYVKNDPLNAADPVGTGRRKECKYYKDYCQPSCEKVSGRDNYACTAEKCCRGFGETAKENCVRNCLIDNDMKWCADKTGEERAHCRREAHLLCYSKCNFFPNLLKLPSSCWRIAYGY